MSTRRTGACCAVLSPRCPNSVRALVYHKPGHLCTCTRTRAYCQICVCVNVCVYIYIYIYIHICMYIYVCIYIYIYIYISIHAHRYITYIHTYIHTHAHTCRGRTALSTAADSGIWKVFDHLVSLGARSQHASVITACAGNNHVERYVTCAEERLHFGAITWYCVCTCTDMEDTPRIRMSQLAPTVDASRASYKRFLSTPHSCAHFIPSL
jgi:hypothetical protein